MCFDLFSSTPACSHLCFGLFSNKCNCARTIDVTTHWTGTQQQTDFPFFVDSTEAILFQIPINLSRAMMIERSHILADPKAVLGRLRSQEPPLLMKTTPETWWNSGLQRGDCRSKQFTGWTSKETASSLVTILQFTSRHNSRCKICLWIIKAMKKHLPKCAHCFIILSKHYFVLSK